jgi:DNA-binding FadR family transcriptional regulator
MIQTVLRTSLLCCTPMVSVVTSSRRKACKLVMRRIRKQDLALQHEAIYRAIVIDRDPAAARKAVRQHMLTVSESLDRERLADTKSRRLKELTQST